MNKTEKKEGLARLFEIAGQNCGTKERALCSFMGNTGK